MKRWIKGSLLALLVSCGYDMSEQPKLKTYEESSMFEDRSSARVPPANTVARGHLETDEAVYKGTAQGRPIDRIPLPITDGLLERGQHRYVIYCSPCHGILGDGRGSVVLRGFPSPPSFHATKLRNAVDGHYFDVITNGFGAMYDYRSQLIAQDRWAVIAYVRALQLSQHTRLLDLPASERARFGDKAP